MRWPWTRVRPEARRRWLLVGVTGLVLSGALVGLGVFLGDAGLGRADQYASVGSLYLGIVGLVVSVFATIVSARQAGGSGSRDGARDAPPPAGPKVAFYGVTHNPVFAEDSEVNITQNFDRREPPASP